FFSVTIFGRAVCPPSRYSRMAVRNSTDRSKKIIFFTSVAESALAGIAALVPVGSTLGLFHKKPGTQLSCQACGTTLHGPNAPSSNLPIHPFPTPRQSAPDPPLGLRIPQWPRHD